DRQQRRQELYREFLKRSPSGRRDERNVLLAWARPLDLGFALGEEPRTVGNALLVFPFRLERPAPGIRVTIPGPLLSYRRQLDGAIVRLKRDFFDAADMHLRFQLPAALLPF